MKYKDFKNKIRSFPLFSSSQISSITDSEQVLRNQITQWRKQGLLLCVKRGLYILNEADRNINPSRLFIANQLLSPSYISTEYALSFYGLIPEKVEDVTSITTKKTTLFQNPLGTFRYQHINIPAFIGFREVKDEANFPFFIAEPEKAIVDFFYLHLSSFQRDDKNIFGISYRFQNVSELDKKRLKDFARVFNNRKLLKITNLFCEFTESGE